MRSTNTASTDLASRRSVDIASLAPACRARRSNSGMSSSFRPGMIGEIEMPVEMPASDNRAMASNRLRLAGACGSTWRATSSSANGMLKYTLIQASSCRRLSTSRSRCTRTPFVMMATGLRYSAQTSRQARVSSNDASIGW